MIGQFLFWRIKLHLIAIHTIGLNCMAKIPFFENNVYSFLNIFSPFQKGCARKQEKDGSNQTGTNLRQIIIRLNKDKHRYEKRVKTSRVLCAVFSQEKFFTFSRPLFFKPRDVSGEVKILQMPFENCLSSNGSQRISVSPVNSGIAPVLDATTGQPHAIASKIGIPNSSYTEGNTNTFAKPYMAGKSFCSTQPGK